MKNKLNKLFIGFVVAFCFGFSACKKKMPNDVLSKGEMEDVLVDYHMAKAMGENLPYSEQYKQTLYVDYVFKKHDITKEAFNSSLEWYSRHTEDFVKIYEKVNKRLNSQRDEIKDLLASSNEEHQQSETGDTVNVWHKQKIYKLTQSIATNKFYFTIYPDSNYKDRDILLWKIRCTFISAKEHTQDAVMSLSIRYLNDSVISETRNISQSGIYNIRLQNDSAQKIREIKGFVYYNHLSHYLEDALIVDKIELIRYHVKNSTKPTITNSQTKGEAMKIDTAQKHQMQGPKTLVNDSSNRNGVRSSMPRRRNIMKGSNDVRVINNRPPEQPGFRK